MSEGEREPVVRTASATEARVDARWGWSDWAKALADHFLSASSAGQPVLLLVDDAVVARMHPSGDSGEAVESLAGAVRLKLTPSSPSGLYAGIASEAHRWKRSDVPGPPPFLPLLAVCVLAASRMGRQQGSRRDHSYRRPYAELLRIPEGSWGQDHDQIELFWTYLSWWLDEHQEGGRGWSTAVPDKTHTRIGYAESQTLFKSSDQAKLADFFRWMELEPGADVDANYLLAHFRIWAPDHGLSDGAAEMLERGEFEPTLERIVGGYARAWDGASVPGSSRREGPIMLRLQSFPKTRLDFVATRPSGHPESFKWSIGTESGIITAETSDWYSAIQVSISPLHLKGGFKLSDGQYSLAFNGGDMHALRIDEEAGGWATVERVRLGERHWLVVSDELWSRAGRDIERLGGDSVTAERAPGELADWRVVRNFIPNEALPDVFEAEDDTRSPGFRSRLHLDGGLPLEARDTYLAQGPPAVALPLRGAGPPLDLVAKQGERTWRITKEVTRLEEFEPEQGVLAIELNGRPYRRVFLVPSSRTLPPEVDKPIAHELAMSDRGGGCGARLRGAVLDGGADLDVGVEPLLLRRSAVQWTVFGFRPGEVEEVRSPLPVGRWMDEVGLHVAMFVHMPSFAAAWVIEEFESEPIRRARPVGSGSIGEPLESLREVGQWAEELAAPARVLPRDREAWMELQAYARGRLGQ